MLSSTVSRIFIVLLFIPITLAYSTWCGKHYQQGSPHTPPPPQSKFSFTHSASSSDSSLLFQCETASSIYIHRDIHDSPHVIIDAQINSEAGYSSSEHANYPLSVSILIDGQPLPNSFSINIGDTGSIFPLDLSHLLPKTTPRVMTCVASAGPQSFTHETELLYAPHRSHGSTVKIDRITGALMVRKGSDPWQKIFPFGWYDGIDTNERERLVNSSAPTVQTGKDPVRSNIERLQHSSRAGFNMIHPVPPSTTYLSDDGDPTAILAYLDSAERLGLWVMYDMRHAFTDAELVAQQVEQFRNHPAILTWYIADEPDGPEGDIQAPSRARAAVQSVDIYHPISMVLNCDDFWWKEFASATDILLLDPYPIALNGAWSKRYNTPVDKDYGCSGCDGCQGTLYDSVNRVEAWSKRRQAIRRQRTMPFWIVPQAFNDHGDEFWWREPLGVEVAAQIVLALNHGVMGHCAWSAVSASIDNFNNASLIARHVFDQAAFVVDSASTRRSVSTSYPNDGENGIDVAAWTRVENGITTTLVLAACFNYLGSDDRIVFKTIGIKGRIQKVLFGDVASEGADLVFTMGGPSVAGVVIQSASHEKEAVAQTSFSWERLGILGFKQRGEML